MRLRSTFQGWEAKYDGLTVLGVHPVAPVDPAGWLYDTGTGYGCAGCPTQWGTFEIESMTTRPRNVALDGKGNLLITPHRDAAGNWTP